MATLCTAIANTGAEGIPSTQLPTVVQPSAANHFNPSVAVEGIEWWIASEGGPDAYKIDLNGNNNFSFLTLEEDFPNIENPVLRPRKSDDVTVNVTAIDLITIIKHILNIEPFVDENVKIAADANNDGVISVTDLSYIQKLILSIFDNFPNDASYRFIPEEIQLGEMPGQPINLEFTAIKVGDVNGF